MICPIAKLKKVIWASGVIKHVRRFWHSSYFCRSFNPSSLFDKFNSCIYCILCIQSSSFGVSLSNRHTTFPGRPYHLVLRSDVRDAIRTLQIYQNHTYQPSHKITSLGRICHYMTYLHIPNTSICMCCINVILMALKIWCPFDLAIRRWKCACKVDHFWATYLDVRFWRLCDV